VTALQASPSPLQRPRKTRNVEVGELLEDRRLAAVLEAQFAAEAWFHRVR
jgi:hypothetical protein